MSGDFINKVSQRLWVTTHQMNILGVLYSSVYMGVNQAAKSVHHEAFHRAGISVSVDDVLELVKKGWVQRMVSSAAPIWCLHSSGCRAYDALFYAEREGLWPAKGPVPLSPEEILERGRANKLDVYDPGRPKFHLTEQDAKYMEILRALEDLRARQDNMVKVFTAMYERLYPAPALRPGLGTIQPLASEVRTNKPKEY